MLLDVFFPVRAVQTKRAKKSEAKPNKGLRHFSVKVSQPVTSAGSHHRRAPWCSWQAYSICQHKLVVPRVLLIWAHRTWGGSLASLLQGEGRDALRSPAGAYMGLNGDVGTQVRTTVKTCC